MKGFEFGIKSTKNYQSLITKYIGDVLQYKFCLINIHMSSI